MIARNIKNSLTGTFVAGMLAGSVNAAVITWNASSGLTPNQVGFQLINNSSPEIPTLSSSILTMSNNSASETMYYGTIEPATSMVFPAVFEASFRMRYVSGSQRFSGRTAAGVLVTTSPNVGCSLYINEDLIFIADTFDSQGPSAVVDTNDGFHDYLLRIVDQDISVYQDELLVLTGNLADSSTGSGSVPRVIFGDATSLEYGTSEWTSFSHNAVIPEPSTLVLLSGASVLLFGFRKKLFR